MLKALRHNEGSIGVGVADFTSSGFYRRANFYFTKFSEAIFESAIFLEEAGFFADIVSRRANFQDAKFCENATFRATKFSQSANFVGATFSKDANFNDTTFSQADFIITKFFGKANFRSCYILSRIFHDSLFQSSPKIEW